MGCSKKKLLVCSKGKSCPKMDSSDLFSRLKKAIATCGLEDYLKVKKVDCLGYCKYGPVVKVEPEGVVYGRLNDEDVVRIALRHAKKKKPVKELVVAKKKKH
jgi:(2Fe-2S) ferredoxin